MISLRRHFLVFLLVLILCPFIEKGGALSRETEGADAVALEKAVSSSHRADTAALLPLPAPGSLMSLGNRQLNDRSSKGKFLVASRQMGDTRFKETVILLIDHDINGAVGLIVNRPTKVKLSEFFPEIKERKGDEHLTYIGGPVGMNQVLLLIRSENKPEGPLWVFDDVYASASKTLLENLIKNPAGEAKFRAYAGYAGWGGGQLEQEILRGDWHVAKADAETIFRKPSAQIWPDLIREAEAIRI